MSSPLQLDQLSFTNVHIQANLDADAERIENLIGYAARVNPDNPRNWQLRVRLVMQGDSGKTPTYHGAVECMGIFTVLPEYPKENVEKLVVVNGSGILYAAIREMVSNITSRGPWPMLTIPTESFLAAYENTKRAQTKTESAKQEQP